MENKPCANPGGSEFLVVSKQPPPRVDSPITISAKILAYRSAYKELQEANEVFRTVREQLFKDYPSDNGSKYYVSGSQIVEIKTADLDEGVTHGVFIYEISD